MAERLPASKGPSAVGEPLRGPPRPSTQGLCPPALPVPQGCKSWWVEKQPRKQQLFVFNEEAQKEPLVLLGHQQVAVLCSKKGTASAQPQWLRPPLPCRRGNLLLQHPGGLGGLGGGQALHPPASLPLQQRGQNTCQRWVLSPRQVWLGSVSSRDTRLPWILNCCVATLGFGLGQGFRVELGSVPVSGKEQLYFQEPLTFYSTGAPLVSSASMTLSLDVFMTLQSIS